MTGIELVEEDNSPASARRDEIIKESLDGD